MVPPRGTKFVSFRSVVKIYTKLMEIYLTYEYDNFEMSVFISDNFVIKYRYNVCIRPTFLFIKKSLHNLCIRI